MFTIIITIALTIFGVPAQNDMTAATVATPAQGVLMSQTADIAGGDWK